MVDESCYPVEWQGNPEGVYIPFVTKAYLFIGMGTQGEMWYAFSVANRQAVLIPKQSSEEGRAPAEMTGC